MSLLKKLFGRGNAVAEAPAKEATPLAADPLDAALRTWLAEEIAPAYAWGELAARPARLEAARLIAARAEDLRPALAALQAGESEAVDRMLCTDLLLRLGEFDAAVTLLQTLAAGTGVNAARAAYLLGEIRYDHGEFDAAHALAERALQLAPEGFGCLLLLGAVRGSQGRHAQTIALLRRALALRPQSLLAIGQLAVALMGQGQLQEGLAVYAAADDLLGAYPHADTCPVWRGEPLAGKRLLVIGAYGYGDVMMFLRYVGQLREREPGVRLAIDVHPPLARLMRATGWFETVFDGPVDRRGIDYQVSTMRLPLVLGAAMDDRLRHEACLRIDEADAAAAATWLPPRRAGVKRVGLRWFGRPMHFDAKRSVPFGKLAPLFEVPGIEWVALVEEAALLQGLGPHPLLDVSAHLGDFYATGALMSQLDLVITVDTSIVHLGGALGRPTWLVARPDYEWRWGESGEAAPWYSAVRVFRHPPQRFDWDAVIADVAAALRGWAARP